MSAMIMLFKGQNASFPLFVMGAWEPANYRRSSFS